MERSDVGTKGRLLFSVKSALAKPAAVTVSPQWVTRFTDFHVGLRRGDIPTGGNLTKVSTYSNSNDTTRHKAYGTPNSRDNTTRESRDARSSPLSTNAVRVLATKCATQRASSCVETHPIPCGVAREAAPGEAETRRGRP